MLVTFSSCIIAIISHVLMKTIQSMGPGVTDLIPTIQTQFLSFLDFLTAITLVFSRGRFSEMTREMQ